VRKILISAAALALAFPLLSLCETDEVLTEEKILGYGAEWRQKYDDYQPPADMVDALKSRLGPDVSIEVYLGEWCADSRNSVPFFIKTLKLTAGQAAVRYIGLPRKANKEIKFFVEKPPIDRVPTFVVYRSGQEIGRIVENPRVGIIEDLMEILFKEE
jgi:hypothetical protein